MFTKFDKNACLKLRADLDEVLQKYAKEHGITIEIGSMKYTDNNIEFKAEAVVQGGKSFREEQRESNLETYLQMYNLKRENDLYEIIGFDTRKWKKPFVLRGKKDNKTYVCTIEQAEHFFKKAA